MAVETLTWTGQNGEAGTIATTGYDLVSTAGGDFDFDSTWTFRDRPTLLAQGSSTAGFLNGSHELEPTSALAYEQAFQPLAFPTSEQTFFFFGNGESRQFSIAIVATTGGGTVRTRNGAGTNVWAPPNGTLVVGEKYILSVFFTRDSANALLHVTIFAEDGTTVIASSGLMTGQNTGTTSVTRVKSSNAKGFSTSTEQASYRFGRPRWERNATGLLVPPSTHNPFYMWQGGQYRPYDLLLWDGGEYLSAT